MQFGAAGFTDNTAAGNRFPAATAPFRIYKRQYPLQNTALNHQATPFTAVCPALHNHFFICDIFLRRISGKRDKSAPAA
jgi:hypothetical protein